MNVTLVDSLLTICTRYTVDNINEILLTKDKTLRPGIILPTDISENILAFSDSKAFVSGNIKAVFKDTTRTRLQNLHLRNCKELRDDTFEVLMAHCPTKVDVHNCPKLTAQSFHTITKYGRSLKELFIGNSIQIFPKYPPSVLPQGPVHRNLLANQQVHKLVIWGLDISPTEILTVDFVENLLSLDLSGCAIEDFIFLRKAKKLRFLSIYNAPMAGRENLDILKGLTELRHLDISQSPQNTTKFVNANAFLSCLVESLPHLLSLDISGTNLGGLGGSELVNQPDADQWGDIPGLKCRVNTPLEFLGLYGTEHDASHRPHIPAKTITGNKDESQILQACQAYMDRPEVLERVINDLNLLFAEEKVTELYRSINLILQAMNRHLGEEFLQIDGSACLYYILYTNEDNICPKLKVEVANTIVNAMDAHKFNVLLMRNALFYISHYQIPEYETFKLEKLISILLEVACSSQDVEEDIVEKAIFSLTYLACQTKSVLQNRRFGKLGVIEKLLQLIEDMLNNQECDGDMGFLWSAMRNLTYKTLENCERFFDGGGMAFYLKCCDQFSNQPDVLRQMLGLSLNVAQMLHLRSKFMASGFITVLYTLLDSTQGNGNMEISYISSYILAVIISEGAEKWTICIPPRQQILDTIRRNINRWDINSKTSIFGYRSFQPIMGMLKVYHTSECQLWAAWTLANLTRVEPERYVPLLKKEKGLEYLSSVINDESDFIRYANLVFLHVSNYIGKQALVSTVS